MAARIFASLLVLGSASLVLTNCGSSDRDFGANAGSPGVAGSAAGAPATAGAPAGGAPAGGGGSSSVGGAGSVGSAGMASGGTAGSVGGGGAGAGSGQGGSGGARAGAGGQATGGGSSAGAGGGSGAFALTSSKLSAGMAFPADYTCAGDDHSPPFAWGPGPSGTMSYALVLQDTNNSLNHWVLYDIPAATSSLPESLATTATLTTPAGAKQKAYQGNAYMGPCPSGMTHTYTFTLYALSVATLPGVTASSSTMALVTAIQANDLASAALSAMSNASSN